MIIKPQKNDTLTSYYHLFKDFFLLPFFLSLFLFTILPPLPSSKPKNDIKQMINITSKNTPIFFLLLFLLDGKIVYYCSSFLY